MRSHFENTSCRCEGKSLLASAKRQRTRADRPQHVLALSRLPFAPSCGAQFCFHWCVKQTRASVGASDRRRHVVLMFPSAAGGFFVGCKAVKADVVPCFPFWLHGWVGCVWFVCHRLRYSIVSNAWHVWAASCATLVETSADIDNVRTKIQDKESKPSRSAGYDISCRCALNRIP